MGGVVQAAAVLCAGVLPVTASALRVSFDLVYSGNAAERRPWRIHVPADSLDQADADIREHYGHRFNPPLRFRRIRAEDRAGEKVAGVGQWMHPPKIPAAIKGGANGT